MATARALEALVKHPHGKTCEWLVRKGKPRKLRPCGMQARGVAGGCYVCMQHLLEANKEARRTKKGVAA